MERLSQLDRDARMYLSRALNTSLAPPDWLSVNLTLRCNLTCSMCDTCYDTGGELTTREVKSLIDQAAQWGVRIFNPLGGELFMRADLEEILSYACQKDFYITVTTNGTLINRMRAEMIATIPTDKLHFNVSFDGPEPAHDLVRGEGMFRRAMKGYDRLREADAAAGNPRRKILANTIVHARNLESLPGFLDELADRGFDGVQLLNLFRRGQQPPPDPDGLWIRPAHYDALDALIEELSRRVRAQGTSGFRILNPEQDIRLIPSYYRDDLAPLEAPCWAGWKELYINADGRAIMCDGQLDFLNGAYGDVRRQTLQQLWRSPELQARRQVVKRCQTPCIQSCYLRRDSDSARKILKGAGRLALDELRGRIARRRKARGQRRLERGELTLELSDTAPWIDPNAPAPLRHFQKLVASSPAPIERCYEDPFEFYEYRNRGYIRFDRGFMGFELVRSIVEDLIGAGLSFQRLRLSWRGEPLMHPEFVPALRWLFEQIRERAVFSEIALETDGRLLNSEIADVASFFGEIPQTWILRGNAIAPWEDAVVRNLDYFLQVRRPAQRVVASWIVDEPVDPHRFVELWSGKLADPWVVAGRLREGGDGIWFRQTDHDHFQADADARERLAEVAEILDAAATARDTRPRRCPAPFSTPVVSWDGKVTLCRRDRELANRVGQVTDDRLSRIWLQEPAVQEARRSVRGRGVPDKSLCRDCHYMFSPNYRLAEPDELSGGE